MQKWKQKSYKWKTVSDKWSSAVAENNLHFEDLGRTYIHPSGKNMSALDHIYFNCKQVENCRKLEISMPDHYPILVDVAVKKKKYLKKDAFVLKRVF